MTNNAVVKVDESPKLVRVATLNGDGHLVGAREIEEGQEISPHEINIDPGDLPLNGTYKWVAENGAFVPLGYDLPLKTKKPPITESYANYLTMRAIQGVIQLPDEVNSYLDWYELNLFRCEEERQLAARRSGTTTIKNAG